MTVEAVLTARSVALVERPHRARIVSALAAAALTGVALGLGTQVLQGWLRGSTAVLANSGGVWALVVFALGLTMPSPRTAAIGGAIALITTSFSYYVAADWFEHTGFAPRTVVVWSVAGIVAGSAFGLAGFVARHSRQHRLSAWALVAGVLIGEGVHLTWYVGNAQLRPAGITELALAMIIATLCLRPTGSRTLVAAATSAAALATLLSVRLIGAVFSTW